MVGRRKGHRTQPDIYNQLLCMYISHTNYTQAIVVAHYRYHRRLLGYRLGYIASCIHLHLASSCARTYVHHLPECVCLLIWVGLGCRLNYIGNGSNWSAYSDYTNDVFADAAVDYDYHDGDDDDGWWLRAGSRDDIRFGYNCMNCGDQGRDASVNFSPAPSWMLVRSNHFIFIFYCSPTLDSVYITPLAIASSDLQTSVVVVV